MAAPATAQQAAPAIRLDTIEVQGNGERANGPVNGYVATRSASGAKTDTPILEVPQTVNVVTADQIRAQGAQSVSEALRYTAGVRGEIYGGASQFDSYTQIRGFKGDLFLDGTRLPDGAATADWTTSVIEPYGLERVEVLKGPSSVLYGQSGPGGLVNMVSKRPTATPFREIQLQTGSYGRLQGAFDLSGPIDPQGQFLYRLTGLGRMSETQTDFIDDDRLFIAPAFTWRPSADTTLTVMGQYLRERDGKTSFNYLPSSGTLYPNRVNGRLPWNRYAGEPGFDRFERDQGSIGYAFEHRFNDSLSFSQNLRYTQNDVYLRALNRNGELLADNRTLNRAAFRIDAAARAFTLDNRLEAKFGTGPLTHTALIGLDYRNEISQYDVGRGPAASIQIFNPVYGAVIADPGINFQRKDAELRQLGFYAQDQIKFERWIATFSGRYDIADVKTRTHTLTTNALVRSKTSDRAFSGRAGLSYVFDNGLAPYVSVSTSFQPTAETDFFGGAFKPLTATQYEAGIKYQPSWINASLTAAVFDIRQQNTLTADPNPAHPFARVQLGEVSVRGFDIEARAQLSEGLGLIASYAFLDHEITKSSVATDIGKRLPSTPMHQGSLWADYTIQGGAFAGLGFGGGIRFVGSTYDTANTVRIPSYTLVDASLSYDLGKAFPALAGAKLSVVAKNLFDRYYVSQCGNVPGCTLGSRRSVLATLTYRW
ncbi:TonB-dependent siderophore receptor [Bosea sp. (in: a-proteobacteria)]|uniref:TonB-dependent siderophore receptor n=1 Tax=Bosea sp. (in: a-proteobacteria) TaxID=1871050 RepID=UPI002DDD26FA|nr:TonB-dependent siderophore receptor [Bosea sp. (in: a-proteobacteria)]HEV2508744.1 TonB-dependent siderophore receptor [Bosea sp. (in: a-proteobacteria)]